MKINQFELSAYLIIIMLTILLASIGVLSSQRPNFSVPINTELPENTVIFTQTPTVQVSQPTQSREVGNFINIVFYILLFVVILVVLRGLLNLRTNNAQRKQRLALNNQTVRRNLEDARTEAFIIIEEGLMTENYKMSFIEAYIALDLGLEDFRDLKRPKHITPKEYSYSVRPPVFKPSVFKIVGKFYELRYGDRDADRKNLLDFRTQLQYLFVEEVPIEIADLWDKEFELHERDHESYTIPRIFEPTQPGGQS